MLDISATRQDFKRHEVSDIGFVRSEENISDGLTKSRDQGKLRACLSGTLQVVPEQWIIIEMVTSQQANTHI